MRDLKLDKLFAKMQCTTTWFLAAIGVLGELQYVERITVGELLAEGKSEEGNYSKYILEVLQHQTRLVVT